eukprot:3362747-Rhodomonas_salina.1
MRLPASWRWARGAQAERTRARAAAPCSVTLLTLRLRLDKGARVCSSAPASVRAPRSPTLFLRRSRLASAELAASRRARGSVPSSPT